jgi:hypothetical protein
MNVKRNSKDCIRLLVIFLFMMVVPVGIGALIYLSMTLVMQRDLLKEIFVLTIKALGLDKRWPRFVPQRLRPSK